MAYFVHSEGGHGHRNEDVVGVRTHPKGPGVTLCTLADGMGGQSGGGIAATWAVEWSLNYAAGFDAEQLQDETTWVSIVSEVGLNLSDAANSGYTTLVCLGIINDLLVGASCGDSAALLINGHGGQQVLTQEQYKNPPLGSGGAIPVAFSAQLEWGWQLVVMSDGVWKYLGWDEIIALASEKRGLELVKALRELANTRCNGKLWDDWSVAVLTD